MQGIVALEIYVTKSQFINISLLEWKVIRTVGGDDLEEVAAFRSVGSWIRRTRKHVYQLIYLGEHVDRTIYEIFSDILPVVKKKPAKKS